VLEDLATVLILVLLPTLVSQSGNPLEGLGLALLKTAVFVAIMLFIGARVMPWLLTRIAYTRSRELFILAVVAVALGTAFAAYELFGISLALGAFLAGVVVSESDVSHQVGAEIIPFRDIFAVLFFVSVGMLVNPAVIVANAGQILALTILIVLGKAVITLLLALVVQGSGRTLIVVAAGLSQIGEFSFIVGQAGLALGLITQEQYGLILAGALLSIVINPLMFRAIPLIEQTLQRIPALWRRMEHGGPTPEPLHHAMTDHVVIVGYGRVGKHIGQVLEQLGIAYLVVEQDAAYAAEIQQKGIKTLFGDAANSEILNHTGLESARALVVTVPNETTAEMVVAAAHQIAPRLPIIARAGTESGVKRLSGLGARHVIHPELEGGLEVVRHTLLTLQYPMAQIQPYVDAVRRDAYEGALPGDKGYPVLDQLLTAVRGVDIAWQPIEEGSPVIGKSLAETNIRSMAGASVIALVRQHEVMPNPKSDVRFTQGDLLGLIGSAQELDAAAQLLSPVEPTVTPV
jgi:monovalent cation:H+ antiporter-2, CPA2 family